MRKLIPWIDVIQRKRGTDYEREVIETYPFPDVMITDFELENFRSISITTFKNRIDNIKDRTTRESTMRRFEFIRDIWHPNNWLEITFKEWKYAS